MNQRFLAALLVSFCSISYYGLSCNCITLSKFNDLIQRAEAELNELNSANVSHDLVVKGYALAKAFDILVKRFRARKAHIKKPQETTPAGSPLDRCLVAGDIQQAPLDPANISFECSDQEIHKLHDIVEELTSLRLLHERSKATPCYIDYMRTAILVGAPVIFVGGMAALMSGKPNVMGGGN